MTSEEQLLKRIQELESKLAKGLDKERAVTKCEVKNNRKLILQMAALVIAFSGLCFSWFELTLDQRREISGDFFKEVVKTGSAPLATGFASIAILYFSRKEKND